MAIKRAGNTEHNLHVDNHPTQITAKSQAIKFSKSNHKKHLKDDVATESQ